MKTLDDAPACIINLSHPTFRQRIPLKGTQFYIGRILENDLCLSEDQTVSRQHCMISIDNSSLMITDCQSVNGTYLNGNRIRGTVPLPIPALVVIGHSRLAVVTTGLGDSNLSTLVQKTYSNRGSIVIPSTLREQFSAFLVVDLVDSTAILKKNAFRLASIVAVLGKILEKYLKWEFEPFLQCTGDGFFATFSSADKAINVAMDLQPRLEKHFSKQVLLSIALHWGWSYLTGEGSRTGRDVYAVFSLEKLRHKHSNINKSRQSSQTFSLILMTGPFHSQLDIKNKRKSAHIGPYQLKGIDDPIEVFRLQNPKAFDDSKPTD